MKSSRCRSSWVVTIAVAGAVGWTTGCGSDDGRVTSETSDYKVAEESKSNGLVPAAIEAPQASSSAAPRSTHLAAAPSIGGATPQRPSARPPESVNRSEPTGNSPQELLAFISELQKREPIGASREAALVDFQQNQQQIIRTAEQLLQTSGSRQDMVTAVEAKLTALHSLAQANVEGTQAALLQYCADLRNSAIPELAKRGVEVSFFVRVNAFALGQNEDPTEMLQDFNLLLAGSTKDIKLLSLARQIGAILQQRNRGRDAQQLYLTTASAFSGVQDPSLAASVQQLQEEGDVAATDIRGKLLAAAQKQEGAEQEFMLAARELLASPRRGRVTSGFLLEAAFTLESNNRPELARQLYSQIGPAFEQHPDGELASHVREKVGRYSRRAGLIGQPFVVDGVDLNRAPFDWSRYRGKVVLVDFWATWCGPCLEEIPNIKANYERFRNDGFEVVGINLDEDPSTLSSFFSLQELPWPTVVSADPQKRGMETPIAVRCGVEFIPFLVLVGRDGRVAALNVRDQDLGPKIAELLSEPMPTGG